ncbi:hypothetical protein RFI_13462, partial [Reticulomyxa filosa]
LNHWLDTCRISHGGRYKDKQIDEVIGIVKTLPFLGYFCVYNLVYAQMTSLFYAQGCQMNIYLPHDKQVPIACLNLFDATSIVLLVPLMDKWVIPFLRRKRFKVCVFVTMLQRIGCGLILSALSMVVAAIVEVLRKESASFDVNDTSSECDSGGGIPVSKISIFSQIPQFFLIGASEVLANTTALEFFFSQSPVKMRSVMTSFYMLTVGIGSWMTSVLIAVVNANKDNQWITNNLNHGHLEYYFCLLAVLSVVNFLGFFYSSYYYQYQNLGQDQLSASQSKILRKETGDLFSNH